jgi:hypothetical protein
MAGTPPTPTIKLKDVIEKRKKSEQRLQRLQDVAPGEKPNEELRNEAFEAGKKYFGYDDSVKDQLTDPRLIYGLANMAAILERAEAQKTFKENIETLVGQVDAKKLGQLGLFPDVNEKVAEKERGGVFRYASYQELKDIADNYEKNGDVRDQREERIATQAAVEGGIESARKQFKAYGREVQELAADIMARSIQLGYTKKDTLKTYTLEGLKKQTDEAKREYEKTKVDAPKAIKSAFREYAEKEDANRAFEILYAAEQNRLRAAA